MAILTCLLQTIYTATGPRQVLTPNFCANSRLFGYEQDMMTGGKCSYTADQLPDENCYYYVTEQTRREHSALPLLLLITAITQRLLFLHGPALPLSCPELL